MLLMLCGIRNEFTSLSLKLRPSPIHSVKAFSTQWRESKKSKIKKRASLSVALHITVTVLTLRLLMSYIYGAPSKARNANVVYSWTYVWQR